MTPRTLGSALLALTVASPAWAGEGLVEFFPLYKDVLPDNPGTEMVQPLMRIVDGNQDGVPEANVRFSVYGVASPVALLSSSPRTIVFPASPCSGGQTGGAVYSVDNLRFQGDGNLSRSHMAFTLKTTCVDEVGEQAAYKTVVYSATINLPAGDPGATVWMKTYSLNLYGFDPDYLTAEGLYILIVSLGDDPSPTSPRTGSGNLRSVGLGVMDGMVIFDATRPLKR
ncbi:MAG: hypothetical protein AB1899_12335 [Pseudomonadota bacterium]